MAKELKTELLGVAAAKALGWSHSRMLGHAAEADADASLGERVFARLAKGRVSPQARTRLLILPISAEVLGLSRQSIAREMFLRDGYERLSAEISEGATPVSLAGFLLHLEEIRDADDAAGAWNFAMAPYMIADLQWDAMQSLALAGLLARSPGEIRQSSATLFKTAYDRFLAFAAKVRSGGYALEARPARLIAARADSMKAIAAEQLYNLALLNAQGDWKLTIGDDGAKLSVLLAGKLLPSVEEVSRFSSMLVDFLPGVGWRRRIQNNKAVISLAIASAAAEAQSINAELDAGLKTVCAEAVATLRAPAEGERVAFTTLPTYESLLSKGVVNVSDPTPKGSKGTKAGIAVAFLAGVFLTNFQPAVKALVAFDMSMAVQSRDGALRNPSLLRLAGPGGTKPRQASLGPGGTVATTLVA